MKKRLIDANAYVDELKWLQSQVSSASAIEIGEYIDRINRQPTVDAVEVVRCKDCKHFWNSFSGTHSCKLHKGLVGTKYDTFCSYGERKDDG